MSAISAGRIWDEAASPTAARLAQRFEADWLASTPGMRPDPDSYLPPGSSICPGARLALLRADLGLRRESGESFRVEEYRARYPDLGEETWVALLYEDFCLREEAGERPDPSDYYRRYSDVSDQLRRVLEIHDLVGSGRTMSLPVAAGAPATTVLFPEVGQTIAGFHLTADLGRGSFAKVFRAEERQLADRPVALKVARTGSREPQLLARLQHTHIVPVYSYRIDPATGLHLLCMPYLGGVTLAQLLADERMPTAQSGSDLLTVIDDLEPVRDDRARIDSAGRQALASRTYFRAIAWWGARMADALQHAHERGVLHRDVKPSNVLVTGDGLPLLLDFNLSFQVNIEDPALEAGALGGTLAYMSPEHLSALAEGRPGAVDGRSDLYSLGVVLFEALGERPFPLPEQTRSIPATLRDAAQQRRVGPPRPRDLFPEVPAELEAVLLRCLAADPKQRYANAAQLAADLQAVADDEPLIHAREPIASRSVRWLRRKRVKLAVAAPLALAPAIVAYTLTLAKLDRAVSDQQRIDEVADLIDDGQKLVIDGEIDQGQAKFDTASRLAVSGLKSSPRNLKLQDLQTRARDESYEARLAREVHADAEAIQKEAGDRLWPRLILHNPKFDPDPSPLVEAALAPFYVLQHPDWTKRPELTLLGASQRRDLFDTVEDVLFLWAVALDRRGDGPGRARALDLCRRGLKHTAWPGPWQALRTRVIGEPAGLRPDSELNSDPPAGVCFRWALLADLERKTNPAIAWLKRAVRDPSPASTPGRPSAGRPVLYWSHYLLGYEYGKRGYPDDSNQAMAQLSVAVALAPDLPWARFERAAIYKQTGALDRAREDLILGLERTQGLQAAAQRLTLGTVLDALGDLPAARREYEQVIAAAGAESRLGQGARLNLAALDARLGNIGRSLEAYEAVLVEQPDDRSALLGRALVRLKLGEGEAALPDLDRLVALEPASAIYEARRAEALLSLGRLDAAAASIESAIDRAEGRPWPALRRLDTRIALARGRLDDRHLDRPEDLLNRAAGGRSLSADLRAAAERLANPGRSDLRSRLNRAVILSALAEDGEAIAEADRAVAGWPGSAQALLVRGRIHHRAGRTDAALDDIARGLELQEDPRLHELLGQIRIESGDASGGLAALDRACELGAGGTVHGLRAEALLALGRLDDAFVEWNAASVFDPEDADARLGRARVLLRRGRWDEALAELEGAAGWAGDRPGLLARITVAYARCLIARPDRLPRVLSLARRAAGLCLGWRIEPSGRRPSYARIES